MIKTTLEKQIMTDFHHLCRSLSTKTKGLYDSEEAAYWWQKEHRYGKCIQLQILTKKQNGKWIVVGPFLSIYNGTKCTSMGMYSSRAAILRAFRTKKEEI